MKKLVALSLIACLLSFFCLSYFCFKKNVDYVFAAEDSFEQFDARFKELIKNDNFDDLVVDKDITISELTQTLHENFENDEEISALLETPSLFSLEETPNVELTQNDIEEICGELKYSFKETDEGYEISTLYKLKRLIVTGYVTNSYGAYEVLTYKDYNILFYETEAQTEYAHKMLKNDSDLIVVPDVEVYVTDAQANVAADYNYSTYKNKWGAEAIALGTYNEYLETNNHGKDVVVAVIDTGTVATHEIFEDRILTNDAGTQVGYSATGESWASDGVGHGTHVAGTIAELTPDNVKILTMKVFNNSGSGSSTYIMNALIALAESSTYDKYNIASVNMSLGIYKDSYNTFLDPDDLEYYDLEFSGYFDKLRAKNILPVVAAGNDSADASNVVPARCDNAITVGAVIGPYYCYRNQGSNEIQVAATGYTDYRLDTSYSNYGDDVDIIAPGTAILAASNDSNTKYVYKQGTSMAAPHVAAAVALLCCDNQYSTGHNATIIQNRLYDCTTTVYNKNGASLNNCKGLLNFEDFNGNITYTATDKTVTYDGNYHNISVTNISVANYSITYKFETDTNYYSSITGNSKFKNYTNGAKKVYFKITATGYKDTTGYATLTINKSNIGISVSNQTSIYGNQVNLDNTKYNITSGTLYSGDILGVNLSTTATNTSSKGDYTISATASNENYNLNYTHGTLTITARPITISLSQQSCEYSDEITFDASAYIVTSALKVVNNDNLNLQFSTNATSSSNVGTYSLTLTAYNTNYSITTTGGSFKINPKTVVISSSQSGIYGSTPSLDILNYSTDISIDKNILNLTLTTEATGSSSVGSYPITFTTTNGNYQISDASSGTYQVKQKSITIAASTQTSTYGETVVLDQSKYSISNGGLVNGDSLSITLSTTATSTSSVNNYPISIMCTGSKKSNYSITLTNGILSITQRAATITARNQNSMYGDIIDLDQTAFTATNLVNGDTLNPILSTTATNRSPVGDDYKIDISCTSSNYEITYNHGYLTITPREITITISNQSGVFGTEVKLQNKYSVTSTNKIVNSDNLNIELITSATSSSPVGDYPITLTYSNENYDVEIINGTYTVVSSSITITLINQTGVYGDEILLDDTKFSSMPQNINLSSLGIELSTIATSSSVVGEYNLTATSSNANIELHVINAKYIITQRPLTLTIQNQTCNYGDIQLDADAYEVGNIVNNDNVIITLSTNATNSSMVANNYVISATCSNANYSVNSTATLSIIPKPITISINDQSTGYYGAIVFDSDDYTLSSEPINGDNLNIELSTTATNNSSVGEYPITFRYNNSNYLITGENAIFTINPRHVEISIDQISVYGDEINLDPKDYETTSTIKVLSGDDLNLSLTTNATNLSNPGEYQIEVVCNNNNYVVATSIKKLTIQQKEITITANDSTEQHIYGNQITLDQTNYTISSLVGEDELIVNLTTTASNLSPVGTYPIVPNYVENDISKKYIISLVNGSLTISKRPIEITIEDQESSHGAEIELKQLYAVTSTNQIVNSDNLNIVLKTDATSSSQVGFYDIWLEYDNDNYEVNVVKGQLEIKQCDLIITIEDQEGVYGNNIVLNQTKFSVDKEIDKSILGVTLTTDATNRSPVGDHYTIDLTLTNTNYSVVVVKGKFEIKPRPITINIQNQNSVYGDINLNQSKFTTSENPISEGFGIILTTDASNTDQSGSKHEINFTHTNSNYSITASRLGVLTINPRPIEITTYQSFYYGNNVTLDEKVYEVKSGSVVNNDDLMLIMTTLANNKSNIGKYGVNISCNNSNYLVATNDPICEIVPRKISISIIQQKQYGDDIILNNQNYTLNSGSLVNGDDLGLILSTNAMKTDSVGGTYKISITQNNPNYEITLIEGKFEITKRNVVVSSVQNVTYGDIVLDNSNFTFKQGSKAFAGDNLNIEFSTNATSVSGVGEYDLLLDYNNSNYNILLDSTSSKVVVKPRKISLRLTPSESVYGDLIELNNSYELISGSIINNDNLDLRLFSSATRDSNVGTYMIECQNNPNYEISLTNNQHTIKKRKITIKLKNQKSPHGIMFEIKQNAYEIIDGVIIENTDLGLNIQTNAKRFYIGKFDLTATASNSNYDVEIIGAEFTLFPSVEIIIVIVTVVVAIVVITIKVKKRKEEKNKNKKLFDKYFGW